METQKKKKSLLAKLIRFTPLAVILAILLNPGTPWRD
jgi:hypothetical protein